MFSFINSEVIIWTVLLLVLAASAIRFLRYWRKFKKLRAELETQRALVSDNVEHSLVLRMMKLATWRIDVANGEYTIVNDYRDTTDTVPMASGVPYSTMLSHIHPDDLPEVEDNLSKIVNGGIQQYHHDYRILVSEEDDDQYCWESSYAMVGDYNDDGTPKTIVGASERIDERKRLEQALMESAAKAEDLNRLKASFIEEMSHEIRTPMNSMNGYAQLLQSVDLSDEERQVCIDSIIDNTAKLSDKFKSLLSIVETETGNSSVHRLPLDVNVLVSNLASQAEGRNKNPQVEVKSYAADSQCVIVSDINMITTIMNNYTNNALKFTHKGQVVIGYDSPRNHKIRLWVKDTGIGMDREQQRRAFDMFVKFDNFTEGVGLGLSVCKNLATNLGGQVGVESVQGHGSTFFVELPTE